MPNKRADGREVSSFTAPSELLAKVREKVAAEGTNLSAVVVEKLAEYVEEP